ncbi:MAG: hypothetical protein ABJ327_14400 [Litoreibacter sp.]
MQPQADSSLTQLWHATSVSLGERAVVITGASGSGKSALALQLMALGCGLISDDQTYLTNVDRVVWAQKPKKLPSKIEARFVGLIDVKTASAARVALVVDMDQKETARFPEVRKTQIFEQDITILRKVDATYFPAAILQYLKAMNDDALGR